MSNNPSFMGRLVAELVPTPGQALAAFFISLLLLTLAQTQAVLSFIGLPSEAVTLGQAEFHSRFSVILQSQIASQIALITFWAMVGLVAYLICWGVYNVLIEARNEVTLAAAYTNRDDPTDAKHWRGPLETLAVKAIAGTGLAINISLLWYGMSVWLALSGQFLAHPSLNSSFSALISVVGLAFQLYFAFVFVQLTFSPWYRPSAQVT